MYVTLAGGKTFTKLDMSHAYQQLELDVPSHAFTTINIHRGLPQYTRLSFGISASTGSFQRTNENEWQSKSLFETHLDYMKGTEPSVKFAF